MNTYYSGDRQSRFRLWALLLAMIVALLAILSLQYFLSEQVAAAATGNSDYGSRKALLLVKATGDFVDDPTRDVETDLDKQDFDKLNEMTCPKIIDDQNNWTIEARAGGRPFLEFGDIFVDGTPWPIEQCTPGSSGIPTATITTHYQTRGVNRLWIVHKVNDTHFPIIVSLTPDGFFNVSGSDAPMLQGSAFRSGFIGKPFSADEDYVQHVKNVNIKVVNMNKLIITYDVISQAGEGVLELTVYWNNSTNQPEFSFRSAHAVRQNLTDTLPMLGFGGFNFMRGPTLHGLQSVYGTPQGGIESFHDSRTAFLVHKDGHIQRNLLTPPVLISTVVSTSMESGVTVGAELILDQPQNIEHYFSKEPTNSLYQQRTDLLMRLTSSTAVSHTVYHFQKSVILSEENPEANETVNLFFATEMEKGVLHEFGYTLDVAAEDFDTLYSARQQGVVFVSTAEESTDKLFFLPLDANFTPMGDAIPLTDGVISDVHNVSVSANGRYLIFDADTYKSPLIFQTNQRVHVLDLLTGAIRRLTVDPSGGSNDKQGSLSGDGTQFAYISNRTGTNRLTIGQTSSGQGSGYGSHKANALDADWCQTQNEIVYTHDSGIFLYDGVAEDSTPVLPGSGFTAPKFSPNCDRIAYVLAGDVKLVNRDGLSNTLKLNNADFPSWIDDNHLLVQKGVGLVLLAIDTGITQTIATNIPVDESPVFVPALNPSISIESPANNAQSTWCESKLLGFVQSQGIPTVTVRGETAKVYGDQWAINILLQPGTNTLQATVIDSATMLTDTQSIDIEFVLDQCYLYLPNVMKP